MKSSTQRHVLWKFIYDDKLVYRNTNYSALKFFNYLRDSKPYFTVYNVTRKGWELVVTRTFSDTCNCGRKYDDTPNGELFRFQESPVDLTTKSARQYMCDPLPCMICYYKSEIKAGRWAPKYVRQLGLET